MSKIFIDTEFLEGTQKKRVLWKTITTPPTIDLISIALVADTGEELYLVSNEFNMDEAWNRDDGGGKFWIRENVLKPIWKHLYRGVTTFEKSYYPSNCNFTLKGMKELVWRYGKTRNEIKYEILKFMTPIEINSKPEFYGYYSDYDWVCFCWIFGRMIDLPKSFPMYCQDLKQELDRIAASKDWYYGRDIWSNTRKPGDIDLQKGDHPASLLEKIDKIKRNDDYPKQHDEHDALSDARFNRDLYNFLKSIDN